MREFLLVQTFEILPKTGTGSVDKSISNEEVLLKLAAKLGSIISSRRNRLMGIRPASGGTITGSNQNSCEEISHAVLPGRWRQYRQSTPRVPVQDFNPLHILYDNLHANVYKCFQLPRLLRTENLVTT